MKLELFNDEGAMVAGVELPKPPKRTNWPEADYTAFVLWHGELLEQAQHLLAIVEMEQFKPSDLAQLLAGKRARESRT